MTDEELDGLVNALNEQGPHHRRAAAAITALRAQLAEAKTEKERLGRELNLARYGQPDFSWQVHKEALSEATARADRAEAALAAQIEADAINADRRADELSDAMKWGGSKQYITSLKGGEIELRNIAKLIRAQPHDRTALDRMLAEAEARGLRKAADKTLGLATGHQCRQAILAMIEGGK